ncbi:PQQ-binding-like beta-propeller repeat protein [Nocardiopsis sp. MG754419]|uniref:outer membrane protein assembly factor BamB family protein n=1 Tax=Nocardiopsis sp. MG754419 TaxID=2259865 RepID=UPI001BA75D38|nr:PQQ-binding-like beta-propeller repeat protein [Nocardiopsis sp. MG754419]MBR8741665.1 hypothetical protein [Nocardiopsis sp. MG754419]
MRSSRVPQALTCGLVALLVAGCTGDPETPAPPSDEESAPVPTEFEGEPPPGIEGEVLRHLHGDDAGVHEILDDPMGVRISPVGGAFLISSGGEDRHLLHDAATGDLLWEGEARFRGIDVDTAGDPVLALTDADDRPFVLDARGQTLWEPAQAGDLYLDGLAVRRPSDWSAEEPDGDYTVLDVDGEELWTYTLEPAEDEDADPEEAPPEEDVDEDSEEDPVAPLGVPVAAWGETVLLDDGDSALHAYSVASDDAGEHLWSVSGEDDDLDVPTSPTSVPQVLGLFETLDPDARESDDEDDEDTEENPDEDVQEEEATRDVLMLRWARPEAPSTLSAHDVSDGDLLWTLREPGANPVAARFDDGGSTGGPYDTDTATLLLPQASGGAPMVAVDLVAGEIRWGLEEEAGAISPAFAHAGFVYGDTRSNEDGDRQLVLEAETMDVVAEDLDAYVEAVTDTGHAILVQGRQRFVYGPGPEADTDVDGELDEPDAEESPEDDTD